MNGEVRSGRSWGKIVAIGCGGIVVLTVLMGVCAGLMTTDDEGSAVVDATVKPENTADATTAAVAESAEPSSQAYRVDQIHELMRTLDPGRDYEIQPVAPWAYGERMAVDVAGGPLSEDRALAYFSGDSLLVTLGFRNAPGHHVWKRPGWVSPHDRCAAEYGSASGCTDESCADSLLVCVRGARYEP